jgi:hypothetical protein
MRAQCTLQAKGEFGEVARVSSKQLCIFFANISSLSIKVHSFLTARRDRVDIAAFVEHHKFDLEAIGTQLRHSGFKCHGSVTPPQTSIQSQNHGGELVAAKRHLHTTPVEPSILTAIGRQTGVPLRLAARYVRLSGLTILTVAIYLWCSQHFSHANNLILEQLCLLQRLCRMPMVVVGDFNMHANEFESSGWPNRLKMAVLRPSNSQTTLTVGQGRLIDYALVSKTIRPLVLSVEAVWDVP